MAKRETKAPAPAQPSAAPQQVRRRQGIVKTEPPPPRTDPRTGKPEVPGQPSRGARARRADTPLRVQAVRMLYYDHKRRRVGDVFTLIAADHFNAKVMKWVDPQTEERITTGQQDINRQHDEILAAKQSKRTRNTDEVI